MARRYYGITGTHDLWRASCVEFIFASLWIYGMNWDDVYMSPSRTLGEVRKTTRRTTTRSRAIFCNAAALYGIRISFLTSLQTWVFKQ